VKKYLLTGSSGFVSFHFLKYLDSLNLKNIEVLGIDRSLPRDMENYKFKNINLHFVELNLLDYKSLEIAIVSFSPMYILHLASFSSVSKSWEDPNDSFVNNTNIFLNLVEILRKNNIKCRLLSIGSSEEYGNVSEDHIPIKESMQLNPLNPYAIARVSQEMLSQCYVASYKLDIVITRSFNHIGPQQRDMFVIPSFVKQVLENIKNGKDVKLYTGNISIIRDFVDVRDVVKAYYLLLEKGVNGELYNVCTGVGYTLKKIIDMIGMLLKIDIHIEVDANRIRPSDNKVIIGDNSKILTHVGWRPEIALLNSLQDLIMYWKEELDILN
jgi:GDP-4-dehydro-6-deoxy-D-mannose reductase